MSWRNILTPGYIRTLLPSKYAHDPGLDVFIQLYIDNLIDSFEEATGIDFDWTDSPVVEVLDNPKIQLNGLLVELGFWQSVTLVESAKRDVAPTFTPIAIDREATLWRHETKPNPIIELRRFGACGCYFTHDQIFRVSGVRGFSPANAIPKAIVNLFVFAITQALIFQKNGGQKVTDESSLNLSRSYRDDGLNSNLLLSDPLVLSELNRVVAKYSLFDYPY